MVHSLLCPAGGSSASGNFHLGVVEEMAERSKRDQIVKVRLTGEEQARFRQICAERGITMSAGVRRLVREAAAFGPSMDGESRAAILELVEQWRAIGVNLNQLTKALHSRQNPNIGRLKEIINICIDDLESHAGVYRALCAPRFERASAVLSGEAVS